MPEPNAPPGTLSLSAAQRHDRICDRFEAAWRAGEVPRIEDWLAKVPADERPALFVELLRLERELRGSDFTPDDYRARFPDFAAQIETSRGAAFAFPPTTPQAFASTTDRPPSDPDLPTIPGYDILGRIDAGGMGVIYKAVHRGFGIVVALKMVRGGAWDTPQALTRFQTEARAVAGLIHPNVVRVYDCGEWRPPGGGPRVPYFTMEYVEGGSLAQRLGGRPLSPRVAAELVETLARAVQYVHDQQIIHRDLKPGNVLMAAADTPKVADFGLAKRLDSDPGLTASRSVLGTASYMAPEQAAGRTKEVGAAADIYALGAILYECLTGRPPFREESYELTISKVLSEDPVPPRRLRPEVPEELEAICLKCLHKEAGQRYTSARALADDLRRFLNGEPLTVAVESLFNWHKRWAAKLGYAIEELIGDSCWGLDYRARHLGLSRSVILRVGLQAQLVPAEFAAFRQQGALVARVMHPNVLHVYDCGEAGGIPYQVLEYVETTLVAKLWATTGQVPEWCHKPWPPDEAAGLVEKLALAADALHQLGIVHGGIHPAGVYLTADGIPKLGGFDAVRPASASELTAAAPWVPSNYLAPEQIADQPDRPGLTTDVYALGAVLYHLLTGQMPFFDRSPEGTRERIRTQPAEPPETLKPDIPPILGAVCLRCMEKDPTRRFASAAEMAGELRRFLQHRRAPATDVPDGFRLTVLTGPDRGTVFPVAHRLVLVGRGADNDIVLRDGDCSENHGALNWDEAAQRFLLVDFASPAGVFVNGHRVERCHELTAGDVIALAGTRLHFGAPVSTPESSSGAG